MHAHTIAQVEPTARGIHLMWAGPRSWVYSPRGWFIQRRNAKGRKPELACDTLDEARIARLRAERVLRLSLGEFTLSTGSWLEPLVSSAAASSSASGDCDVLALELDQSRHWVRVDVTAKLSFAFALREGKVVATAATPRAGVASFVLSAADIDTVVLYALAPQSARFCVQVDAQGNDWKEDPYIVNGLQLPLRELIPTLSGPDAEFEEAVSRLLPGETLDREEFERLTQILRASVSQAGPPRPLDQVELLREDVTADFEETTALDPIRVLLSHPKWRRVLGFGWFDRDPSLVVGASYDYRITGFFPASDLSDRVYGWHTVPSQTALPAEFYLHDLRIRLPQPTRVERAPGTASTGHVQMSRRGIRLHARDEFFWMLPSLDDWSAVIDFPSPVGAVVLELTAAHALQYAAADPDDPFVSLTAVPPGPRPRLDFPTPVSQLRLQGDGFLHAIRIPTAPPDLTAVSIELPAVALVDTPRPEPPMAVDITNLQQAQEVSTSDVPDALPAPRHALGFEVRWRPTPLGGVMMWPPDEPPPPLDATLYQIEHRESGGASWTPVLPEENWMLGDRDESIDDTAPYPGADLMQLFPEARQPSAGLDCYWRDVFDFSEGGGEVVRPVPMPGTFHQYRVRSVDPIGRPSATWRETGLLRLEKWLPPPVPIGPDETPADAVPLPEPMGVQARVLARDAPDLTAADRAVLGDDDNAIVLRWGWHQQQRDQDPFAREFRVYVADQALDAIPGQLVSTVPIALGRHQVTLELDRTVVADAARRLRLKAGRPFRILTHTGGSTVTAIVDVHVPGPDGQLPTPALGPVLLPLRLTPNLTRAPAWSERIEVVPITAAVAYQTVIRNRLSITADHPSDTIWVGVSAADDQAYVPDPLAPGETRPGNEGAVVPVMCVGRYYGRPVLEVPPALDPVPVLTGPEPSDRPMRIDLDLTPFLTATGLGAGDLVRPERAAADAIFAACFVSDDGRVMARAPAPPDDADVDTEVIVPNPGDRAAVIAALDSGRIDALDDRFVVFLAGSHPYRDRLFAAAAAAPVPHTRFTDTVPSKPARYVYRVRQSDAAGHLSAGGAVAAVIVRVPSVATPGVPEKLTREGADLPGTLRLVVPNDLELTHLLTFHQVVSNGASADGGELLRIPNRPDLYPSDGIRLRAPDGELLAAAVKALSDADVVLDGDGMRRVEMSFTAPAGQRVRVWACSLSRDGIPSRLVGPWGIAMPLAPLPTPALSVSGTPSAPTFTWVWPTGPRSTVALQRSPDGTVWTRISGVLPESVTTREHRPPTGSWHYRLLVMSPDGRTAPSNVVAP